MTYTSAAEVLAAGQARRDLQDRASAPDPLEARAVLGRGLQGESGSLFWSIAGGILTLQRGTLCWSADGRVNRPAYPIGYCGEEDVGNCIAQNWHPHCQRLGSLFRVIALRIDVASREGFEVFA